MPRIRRPRANHRVRSPKLGSNPELESPVPALPSQCRIQPRASMNQRITTAFAGNPYGVANTITPCSGLAAHGPAINPKRHRAHLHRPAHEFGHLFLRQSHFPCRNRSDRGGNRKHRSCKGDRICARAAEFVARLTSHTMEGFAVRCTHSGIRTRQTVSARADAIATTPRAKVLSSISHLELQEGRVYCGSEMRLLEFLSPSSFSSCMPRSLHILRTYQHAPRGWRIRESTSPTHIYAATTTTAIPLRRTWSSR